MTIGSVILIGQEAHSIARDWNQMDGIERFHRVGMIAGPLIGGGLSARFSARGMFGGRGSRIGTSSRISSQSAIRTRVMANIAESRAARAASNYGRSGRIAVNTLETHIPTLGRKFNQIARRGWTRTTINETVNNPFTIRTAMNRSNRNPAAAFFNADGTHVIRDNVTGQLVQLSDKLSPNAWIPDSSIVNPFIP